MRPEEDIVRLVRLLEQTQWTHQIEDRNYKAYPVITRSDLRNIKMEKGLYRSKTSGSTGEPVTVEKTYSDYIWYVATNIREVQWRKWDVTKNKAVIRADGAGKPDVDSWQMPREVYPVQGKTFMYGCAPIPEIQKWLEHKDPHYIHSYPSVLNHLNLARIPNLIDVKSTGEKGGTMYSSAECGTIAIQCPDNPKNWHVMENQIVEVDENNNLIITTITNKYIKRYRHGDVVTLGACDCGRKLQTITDIQGRVRNMFTMPDGTKKWPLIGARTFHEKYGIRQFKAVQTALGRIELQVVAPKIVNESDLSDEVRASIEADVEVRIVYVESFPDYKHEEFVSLL